MRWFRIARPGGPERLEMVEADRPHPQGDEVLIRVRAFGLNRADLLQIAGRYPAPPGWPAEVPGLEVAGEVVELGPRVGNDPTTIRRVGDRVAAVVGGGAYAEFVVVPAPQTILVPESWSDAQAAAVPEAFLTAHDALTTRAEVQPGERVLIHAVGSGVGVAALQLAKMMGCETFGTSRTPEKLEKAVALGLDHPLPTTPDAEPYETVIARLTADQGVHAALEFLGGANLDRTARALALGGRIALIGLLAGATAQVDLGLWMSKRLRLQATTLRNRSVAEKTEITRKFVERAWPWLTSGRITPILDAVYPVERLSEALQRMAANTGFGKTVIVWDE